LIGVIFYDKDGGFSYGFCARASTLSSFLCEICAVCRQGVRYCQQITLRYGLNLHRLFGHIKKLDRLAAAQRGSFN